LSRRLLGEQEAERARIARELHDDINQQLTLLALELDRLLRAEQPRIDNAQRLSRALQAVHGVAMSVRELSHRLHPARLQIIGLVESLDNLRRDLSPPHLAIAFSHRDVPEIEPEIALCLFRVTQEALGNAVKHSGARHVHVDLTAAPSRLELTIADDGKGFDVDAAPHAGLGLISMRERVESVGGALGIQATPGGGTRLTVIVPLHVPEPVLAAVTSA
jgi:signal transduction histidine kinase